MAMWAGGLATLVGCGVRPPSGQAPSSPPGAESVSGISADELFQLALDNLEHLEKYHVGQMLQQVVERLNQWIKFQHRPDHWRPDPLISRLPKQYQELPSVRKVAELEFPLEDGYVLLAALWTRDLAKWISGQTPDELQQAQKLFDWTVRNIQLQPAGGEGPAYWRQLPWETLLLGRGSSLDRAWVFILLARQLGIEAFLIALAPIEEQQSAGEVPWAVGVLRENEIYVFDPTLGIPIPGPEGVQKGAKGGLEILPASLRQLADNPLLLRRLDLGPQERYPVASVDLARAVALIAALPAELSLRMQMVESRLVGGGWMSLSVQPSQLAERIKAAGGVRDVKLWTRPFTIAWQRQQQAQDREFALWHTSVMAPFWIQRAEPPPRRRTQDPQENLSSTQVVREPILPLWRGRVAHLRGNLSGERGASYFYHLARPPESELNIAVAEGKMPLPVRDLFLRAKQDASYWLGLVCFDLGEYQAALDYFQKRCLELWPDGPWRSGAYYNLGRTYEALAQYEQAIRSYEADPQAPDHYGRRLRARWIKEHFLSETGSPSSVEKSPSPPPLSKDSSKAPSSK
ncbi:MAG: tetratricopeptide repeat protein [Thermoguttaceae bacterium]|nr:tetratricopeptide repeat protein [Thermoguttaceae bacterium]MDW8036565.1 tetratricopeptide repeat protein [Thermoguttaceae bacterium]